VDNEPCPSFRTRPHNSHATPHPNPHTCQGIKSPRGPPYLLIQFSHPQSCSPLEGGISTLTFSLSLLSTAKVRMEHKYRYISLSCLWDMTRTGLQVHLDLMSIAYKEDGTSTDSRSSPHPTVPHSDKHYMINKNTHMHIH